MGWGLDSCRPLLLYSSDTVAVTSAGGRPTPAAGRAAGAAARRKPPASGAVRGASRRSGCGCAHRSSGERANCPLQSWTAVSCQREIRDLSAGTLSFLQLSAERPQRNGLVSKGGEGVAPAS